MSGVEFVEDVRENGTGLWYQMDLLVEDVSSKTGKGVLRCTACHKIGYPLEKHAKESAERIGDSVAYFSQDCRVWHTKKIVRPGGELLQSGTPKSPSPEATVAAPITRPLSAIVARDYQEGALDALFRYFEHNFSGNPIVAMPTGTGKAIVNAEFIHRACMGFPGTRILCLTHVKELIEQNFKTLMRIWPTAPAGVYSAGLGRKEHQYDITFAGIQSIYQKTRLFGHIDLVLIDECHLVNPNSETMYAQFIQALRLVNPNIRVIGFSATPYRMKSGMLTDEDGLFNDVAFDLTSRESFNWLIQQGWLVPLIPKRTNEQLDTSGVKIQGGEYNLADLQERVDRDVITIKALEETVREAENRQHWLIYATGIEHAEHIASFLNDQFNIPAAAVHSKLEAGLRDQRIKDFRSGKLRAIVNNNILTTGFDYPDIDCEVSLRPTMSPGLWVQMLGRGTRPVFAPGYDLSTAEGRLAAIRASHKPNCLVLDFAGNTKKLGPINDPVIPFRRGKRIGVGIAPVRLCEKCGCYSHASARFCENVPDCGAEFPQAVKFAASASTEELIAGSTLPIVEHEVNYVQYRRWEKPGKPLGMRVIYQCGLRQIDEWVLLDHQGYARKMAQQWWSMRIPGNWPTPPNTEAGFAAIQYLRVPKRIRVLEAGKYPKILGHEFA